MNTSKEQESSLPLVMTHAIDMMLEVGLTQVERDNLLVGFFQDYLRELAFATARKDAGR